MQDNTPQSDIPIGWHIRGECYWISRLTWTPSVSPPCCENDHGWSSNHSLITFSFPKFSTPYDSQTWHCLSIQVTLREGQGLNPLSEYAWMGSIVTDVFSEIKDLNKEAVLVLEQAVLFFGRWSQGDGLSYKEAQDAAFYLSGDLYLDRKAESSGNNCPYYSRGSQGSSARCCWEMWRG